MHAWWKEMLLPMVHACQHLIAQRLAAARWHEHKYVPALRQHHACLHTAALLASFAVTHQQPEQRQS